MAIINCPECDKKVSDKAAVCENCGFMLGEHDIQSLMRKRALKRQERMHSLNTQAMLAVLLFIIGLAGTAWVSFEEPQADAWIWYGSMVLAGLGFVWYLINRVRISMLKRTR